MARRVVGYRGGKPLYEDEGPGRGRMGQSGGGDAIGRLGVAAMPDRESLESGDRAPIERRQLTQSERAARAEAAIERVPTLLVVKHTRVAAPPPVTAAVTPSPVEPDPANGAAIGTVSSLEEGSMAVPAVAVLKRDGVAVLAPCADCSHASVCSIRPTLAGKGLDTDFTSSIAGIRVVAVSLECSFFLPKGSTNGHVETPATEPDDDVVAALLALGYKSSEARQLARAASGSSVEDRLRSALRGLVVTDAPGGVTPAPAPIDPPKPVPVAARPSAPPVAGRRASGAKLPWDRAERDAVVLAAVRSSDSADQAGAKLGVSGTRVEQVIREIREAGQMPDDVALLLATRGRKPKAASA